MNRLLTPEERHDLFPSLYESCFGVPPDEPAPPLVIVHENEGVINGFVAGFKIGRDTFFYSFGGVVQGKDFIGSRKHFMEVYNYLRNAGIKWCEMRVENTNTTWQRLAMSMGWIPYGIKVHKGIILVEYFKEL